LEWKAPDAVLDVVCSKGTYIRVLAEDIGQVLGCGAHLAGLRRTATGGFEIGDALTLEQLEAMSDASRDAMLLPAATLVRDLPPLRLAAGEAARFRQGGAVPAPGMEDGSIAAFAGDDLLGVAIVAAGQAQPRRVVAAPSVASDGHG
jgi:tRNA pseudouridine55 synthase